MSQNYFLKMIQYLRENEEVMLYQELLDISEIEATEVTNYLKKQYEREALDFPFQAPPFDEKAALWAAKTIYISAQLLLYRENKSEELLNLIKNYEGTATPSGILSIDLSLRFLPDIMSNLKMIDTDDPLLDLLEKITQQWHYSCMADIHEDIEKLDFTIIVSDKCLLQLYCNRVIYFKKLKFAIKSELKNTLLANLGFYIPEFWNELKLEMRTDA